MPYDLYVSRGVLFGVEVGPDVPAAPAGQEPIGSAEFHEALRGAPATRAGEHVYWVRHEEGDPWFAAQWEPRGQILLSTSYTHHRFLRNLGDLVDQGMALAEQLSAHLFEEVRGLEITPAMVDELLEPQGEYVQRQAATWRGGIEKMWSEGAAALEYPLGPVDLVSEYFGFHLAPAQAVGDEAVPALLERGGVRAEAVQPGAWCGVDPEGVRLVRVLRVPDGRWQIWPAWGRAPFSRLAAATLAAAEALHALAGGDLRFLGQPFDGALREAVRGKLPGLGVEFFLWAQAALRGATR